MGIVINLSLIFFCLVLEFVRLDSYSLSFAFENLPKYGLRERMVNLEHRPTPRPNFHFIFDNKAAHPEPLPETTLSPNFLRSSYNIYQGLRRPNDTRVFRRKFQYNSKPTGHHVFAEGNFDCIITHLAVETRGGIPTLLRGGVGYRNFLAVARAKPWNDLEGTVRAYCLKKKDE